jgi:hypothetical protein
MRCLVCGRMREEGKFTCDRNHTYAEYKTIKSKVWNDPWPYFPIGFGGFWIMTYVISAFLQSWSLDKVGQNLYWLLTICLGVPIIFCFILHDYRQKKKGLPFWGLNELQEEERILGPITSGERG